MATKKEIMRKKGFAQEKVQISSPNASPPPVSHEVVTSTPQPTEIHYHYGPERAKRGAGAPKTGISEGLSALRTEVKTIKENMGAIQEINEIFNPTPALSQQLLESEWVGGLVGKTLGGLEDYFLKKKLMEEQLMNDQIRLALQQGLIQPKLPPGYVPTAKGQTFLQQQMGANPNPNPIQSQPQTLPQQGQIPVTTGFLRSATEEDLREYAQEVSGQIDRNSEELYGHLKRMQDAQKQADERKGTMPQQPQPQPQAHPVAQPLPFVPPTKPPPVAQPRPDNSEALLRAINQLGEKITAMEKEIQDIKGIVPPQQETTEDVPDLEPWPGVAPEIIQAIQNKLAEKMHRKKDIGKIEVTIKSLLKLNKKELLEVANVLGIKNMKDKTNPIISKNILEKIEGR